MNSEQIKKHNRMWNGISTVCSLIVLLAILGSPLWYFFIVNAMGASTDYFDQSITTAKQDHDGQSVLHVGDPFRVHAGVIRHLVNGSCQLAVWRVRENVGGKFDGRINLLQYIDQTFVGDGVFRHTSWPLPPIAITVTDNWFDDPDAKEQTMDVFVIARYYCNMVDDVFPRWLRSPDVDHAPLDRHISGFEIPRWNPNSFLESAHTRFVIKRRDVE